MRGGGAIMGRNLNPSQDLLMSVIANIRCLVRRCNHVYYCKTLSVSASANNEMWLDDNPMCLTHMAYLTHGNMTHDRQLQCYTLHTYVATATVHPWTYMATKTTRAMHPGVIIFHRHSLMCDFIKKN